MRNQCKRERTKQIAFEETAVSRMEYERNLSDYKASLISLCIHLPQYNPVFYSPARPLLSSLSLPATFPSSNSTLLCLHAHLNNFSNVFYVNFSVLKLKLARTHAHRFWRAPEYDGEVCVLLHSVWSFLAQSVQTRLCASALPSLLFFSGINYVSLVSQSCDERLICIIQLGESNAAVC